MLLLTHVKSKSVASNACEASHGLMDGHKLREGETSGESGDIPTLKTEPHTIQISFNFTLKLISIKILKQV